MDIPLFMANAVPKGKLIDELEIAIKKYKSNPNEQNEKMVMVFCSLLMRKEIIETMGFDAVQQKMDNIGKIYDAVRNPDIKAN